ncbi:MAG: sigma-70 family RNA polymerase sigma factor [Pirellulaceae bacterium]
MDNTESDDLKLTSDEENSRVDVQTVSQLIHRAKTGCSESYDGLLAQLQGYLQLVAERHHEQALRAKIGVSDIVQQSLVKAVDGFDSFRGNSEGELKAWLKTLLINEIRQVRRGLFRQRRDVGRERSLDAGPTGQEVNWLRDSEPTPQTLLFKQEQIEALHGAIVQLSDSDQQVIQLRSFEKKGFDEIAAIMGRSVDAVTKLWYRAVLRLQKIMSTNDETSQS